MQNPARAKASSARDPADVPWSRAGIGAENMVEVSRGEGDGDALFAGMNPALCAVPLT